MLEKTIIPAAWLYHPDRPVGLLGDLLWGEGSAIRQQIKEIAKRIIAPLTDTERYPENLSESITFAVHGGWGSGKSSVLRMIREGVQILAEESPEFDKRVKFCEYLASAHEGVSEDVRSTMALRSLQALAEDQEMAVSLFNRYAAVLDGDHSVRLEEQGIDIRTLPIVASGRLQELATTLAQLIDFDRLLTRELTGQGESSTGMKQVMVVLIDDLDRCRPEFVSDILDAVQQWSTVPNLFFILAIDQDALRRAVEEKIKDIAAPSDPYYALEKYIQHIITVPPMDDERLAAFVQALLADYEDPVSRAIAEEVIYLQRGLQIKTPRAVKRCLNTIRPDIQQRLLVAASGSSLPRDDRQRIVKERVLEYSWRDFYDNYFVPAVRDARRPYRDAFTALEKVCADFEYGGADEDLLQFQISRIQHRLRDEKFDVPPQLAQYLALPPYWLAPRPEAAKISISIADMLRGVRPVEEKIAGFQEEVEDIQEQFMQLYFRSEAADAEGNRAEALRLVDQLYRLVTENPGQFGEEATPTVGNAAVTAEKHKANDLARKLYELALELNPEHSNNLQNFVDFIVDAPMPELYDKAAEYLAKLETGKHATHQPERTLLLKVRLAQRMGQPEVVAEGEPDLKQRLIAEFERDPTDLRRFAMLVKYLAEVGDYATIRWVAQELYDHAESDEIRYLARRTLADMLADSPDERNEREAMDIYREFYEQGVERNREDYLHNYATLLYKHDYDDKAGEVWFEAYSLKPMDPAIRRAYSMYLLRAGNPELAQKVASGETPSELEKVLQPRTKELPERFADVQSGEASLSVGDAEQGEQG